MKIQQFFTIVLLLLIACPVFAYNTLYEYYTGIGESLPTLEERQPTADLCQIPDYVGTAEQNDDLLRCLEYTDEYAFGATIPIVVALFETSLASKISSSATSMTLVSGSDKAGNDLSGYMCFVIDEGSASEEFVCGTASSTAISSMTRGLDPQDGKTEITALKEEHRRGQSVKITNFPQIGILSRILNGDETLPNILTYESEPTFTVGSNQIPTVKYVDDLTISGISNATRGVKGGVELPTLEEIRSGATSSSSTAPFAVEARWFASTSPSTSSIPITDTDGKLDQSFIDLTETFSYTASTSMESASTTDLILNSTLITATGDELNVLAGATSSVTTANLNTLVGGNNSDSSGLHYHSMGIDMGQYSTSTNDDNGTTTVTLNHDLGAVPSYIRIDAMGQCNRTGESPLMCHSFGTATSTASQMNVWSSILSSSGGSGVTSGIENNMIFGLWDRNNNLFNVEGKITSISSTQIIITLKIHSEQVADVPINIQWTAFK